VYDRNLIWATAVSSKSSLEFILVRILTAVPKSKASLCSDRSSLLVNSMRSAIQALLTLFYNMFVTLK
jgi:hypothetical protein